MLNRLPKIQDCNLRPVNVERMDYLGSLKRFEVYSRISKEDDSFLEIFLVEPRVTNKTKTEVVLKLVLSQCADCCEDTWEVDMIRVSKRYLGLGIAVDLYVFLMRKHGFIIQAGRWHTLDGRKLWRKLIDVEGVALLVGSEKPRDVRCLAPMDIQEEIEEELRLKIGRLYGTKKTLWAQWIGKEK